MSGKEEAAGSGIGTARFALQVGDASIQVEARLPDGPVKPDVLLPVLRDLSDSLSKLAERGAEQAGQQITCREGCGACCRQAVPITPVEARAIAEWLDAQPPERQAALRERFQQAAARLEESGIAQQIRESDLRREVMRELGLRYFALGIACPFLEEERCTIHEIRPLRCREYLVVSPAAHCAHPGTMEIVRVRPPAMLSQALAQWDTNGDPQKRELIVLAMLDEWAAKHPVEQDRAHRTSPELLQEFLRAFAREP
jgi:Fe-S-cluster containining protein